MNKADVAKLLTIASGFDRRQVDTLTVEAWHQVPAVASADYDAAVRIVIDHQTGTQAAEYFTVRHLVAGLVKLERSSVADIETDVRAAKARGILPQDWPARQALPADAAHRLADARARDRAEAARFEIEA